MHRLDNPIRFRLAATITWLLMCLSGSCVAWGTQGHSVIGVLALEEASDEARHALAEILGSIEPGNIADACNWPEEYRDLNAGEWSTPLHYINIAPPASAYNAQRDCPDNSCVTAAIVGYASELGDRDLSRNARQQAFAFLCHFTGDLHQPLHAGFDDDQGGNLVDVVYLGEDLNLHEFWDSRLINEHSESWQHLAHMLRTRPDHPSQPPWQVGDAVAWTNESHTLVKHFSYPLQVEIDAEFAAQSWRVTQHQLATAASRLAVILDAVLGGEE